MLRRATRNRAIQALGLALLFVAQAALARPEAGSTADFERSYNPRGPARLTISNVNGAIRVSAWEKNSILVRAATRKPSIIEDRVMGGDVLVSIRASLRTPRVEFEVRAPSGTSLSLKNVMGDIDVTGMQGHVSILSFDGDVKLSDVSSQSLEVKITSGDIDFDGELHPGGSYNLQTVNGDIDVTLPRNNPFNLNARALTDKINLGAFGSELSGGSRSSRGYSGTHLRGGPRLTLTTYNGRILMHKR
jgi:hypothetical protein